MLRRGNFLREGEIDGKWTLGVPDRAADSCGRDGVSESFWSRGGRGAWPEALSSAAADVSQIHSPRGPRRAIILSDIIRDVKSGASLSKTPLQSLTLGSPQMLHYV